MPSKPIKSLSNPFSTEISLTVNDPETLAGKFRSSVFEISDGRRVLVCGPYSVEVTATCNLQVLPAGMRPPLKEIVDSPAFAVIVPDPQLLFWEALGGSKMNTSAGKLSVNVKLDRSVSPGAVTDMVKVVGVPGGIFAGLKLFVALNPKVEG